MQTLAYLPWAITSYESEAFLPANTSYESDLKKPRLSELGVDIINLEKMWDQMQKAAEKIVAVDNTRDILVASDSMMPRLGTLTTGNKPRLLILTYPKNENHMRLIEEANLAKIPMIAFCETDCPMKYVDGDAIVIPADFNEIALPWLFWFLSKMILHYRGLLPQDKQWESSSPYDIDRWEEWEWAVCEEKNCNNVKYQHQKEEEEEYCTRRDRQVEMIVTEVILGIKIHKDLLKNECPNIVVGTPGGILALTRDKDLSLRNVRHFILDECDKMLESLDMRRDVQEIFKMTPHDKQVMMFSATLSKEIRPVCKKFMQDAVVTVIGRRGKVDPSRSCTHYIKLSDLEKKRKLNDLLDALDFNQVVIFVKSVSRAAELNKLLVECNFPSICIHSGMSQEERLTRYKGFKEGHKRILVATDLVGRGIDIERVNIVINYDMPDSADTYLYRVGRAGRFGTKGLAITFVSSASDSDVLNQVQERFEVDIKGLPEQLDISTYMPS
ncbi:hypothetical protein OROGR_010853 [Orobanche gracilis]